MHDVTDFMFSREKIKSRATAHRKNDAYHFSDEDNFHSKSKQKFKRDKNHAQKHNYKL